MNTQTFLHHSPQIAAAETLSSSLGRRPAPIPWLMQLPHLHRLLARVMPKKEFQHLAEAKTYTAPLTATH